MKKKILAGILALGMAVSMAACGGGGGTANTGNQSGGTASGGGSGTSGGANSLTVNIWDSNQQAGIQKIADEWSETSGVSVKVEVINWDNYWTLLEAGVSGGKMPDVFWMHSNTAQMYMENDVLLKLNDYVAADSAIDQAKYYEGVWNLYTRTDGNIYALPKDHDTIALLYNKAIFDKYGVAYPDDNWSWTCMRRRKPSPRVPAGMCTVMP